MANICATDNTINSTDVFGFNNNGTLFDYINRQRFVSPGGVGFDGGIVPGTTVFSPNFQYITGFLNEMVLPLTRYNVFSQVDYEINPFVEVYGQFLYTQFESKTELAPTPSAGGATGVRVPYNNLYVSSELAAILATRPNPTGTFLLDKRFNALGPRRSVETYSVGQMTLGARGDLGLAEDWTYDIYAAYGRVQRDTVQTGNVSRSALQQLLNSNIAGVSDGGNQFCAGGYDWFGETALSAACQAFIGRTSKNKLVYEQRNVEAVIQGPLFELPAGEVLTAFGASYREDTFDFLADGSLSAPITVQPTIAPLLTGNDIAGFNPSANLSGETNVAEIFGEVLIPILSDVPAIQELNVTLAGRSSDYNTVGRVETYKGDVDWTVVDGLRFRGGYSQAIRAPSVGELFGPQLLGFPSVGNASATGNAGDPCDINSGYRNPANAARAASVRALCVAQGVPLAAVDTYTVTNNQVPTITGGNPNLAEETATTWSAGIVVAPQFGGLFDRLSFSLDYYKIEVEGAIGAIGVGTGLQQCFNAGATGTTEGTSNPTYTNTNFFCALIQRNPLNGNITNFPANNQNLGGLFTSGVDFLID
ncbi:MAG: TonB-dependent receptor, partial [Pyrinomonadaceae bacterium]